MSEATVPHPRQDSPKLVNWDYSKLTFRTVAYVEYARRKFIRNNKSCPASDFHAYEIRALN